MAAPSSRLSLSSVKTSGSEAYYKSNLDLVLKENKQLRQRLDQLEKENRGLKKAVYDLSVSRHSACIELGRTGKPFDINSIITPESSGPESLETADLPDIVPQKVGIPSVAVPKSKRQAGGRQFYLACDLKGHKGPVYAAQFARASNLLASGSFDQSVRIWDVQTQREVQCFQEHQQNVADVDWSSDGTRLLSGGFDHCVKDWDVVAGKVVHSYSELQGFIQAVHFNPADNDVFLAGSTSKHIYVLDRRLHSSGGLAMLLTGDAKVGALVVSRSGNSCLSGDSHGAMKLWDLRTKACVETVYNEDGHKPITSLSTSSGSHVGNEEGVHLAVNSYDNVLRVYDRYSVTEQPPLKLGSLRLVHSINGTRTKNWPIKSSMFQGHDYQQSVRRRRHKSIDGLSANGDFRPRSPEASSFQDASVHDALLLATGSADNFAYIFDVSGPSGTSELVQRLEGHTDRVCAAVFHPVDPILTTCSSDFTLKIWSPRHLTDIG
uniref:Uncharacterized protein n=1 Tax=Physcomitrium patens TaxID=3218 RepID=A0A7I4CB56_PHYPA|nr:WD repeat-containing protein 5B-like isoform X1 [Physcomitrium patens]XP_024361072.1 WD repeat-containing protein 5B-like isoform X1 [Physcomitrium patens]XP_024361073.1 WD repeat-containing protein 5B-like isoform X1 [Physcomitrium patens]XP_024361074.1 WD repeat-containing protein 5B-like isoform X1 [Physcomitrium patens]XP_024361075.1 WD repeat-containing protein 5B-like isoform X1 [Physcomitrium patens]XP_024361077.1 WD repeat-containing protein 5B-like isoform X1 [Physcomitrium patens]|eukprot:XP_024361071.1 WD repeat-containing protein 5B-like isoform X1 [Physcomitrella patens]